MLHQRHTEHDRRLTGELHGDGSSRRIESYGLAVVTPFELSDGGGETYGWYTAGWAAPKPIVAAVEAAFAFGTGTPPTLQVQAAFGQNPFTASTPQSFTWTTLPNVRSYSETTGRQHELQRFEAGTAQILLDGTDGRYLPWNTSGPYYGSLTIGTPVQVSASYQGVTYPVFYGYAQSWTPQWVGTGYSNTMLALYDGLQFLSLYEMANGSLYPNLVKSEGVAAFWRFSDSYPANPPSAYIAELIGNYTAQVMGLTIGSQSFGVAGPIVYDPATALSLPSGSSIQFPVAASSAVGSGAGTIEFWLDNLTGATTVQLSPYSAGAPSGETYLDIGIFGTGQNGQVSLLYNLGEVNSSISVNDGNPHHIVFTWTGWNTGTVSLYVDGVLQGSASSTAYCSPFNVLVGSTQLIFNVAGNSVTVANMAWYPSALNSTQVAANFNTGFLLQAVQSTGARIQTMLETLIGVPAAYCSLANGITTNCQGETSSVVGTKALDYIDNIVQTEQSQFFQSPAGVFTFQDRHWAMDSGLSVISQLFCSNDPAHPGCQYEFGSPDMPLDDLDFFNVFTVTRINGVQQFYSNIEAVASGLLRQQDITGLYYLTDAESLQCAEWLALKYGNPLQRVQALDLELYNADGSNTPGSGSYIAQILALLFMSRVTVRRVGYAAGDVFQQDSLVEGIDMSVVTGDTPEWKVTLHLQPYDISPPGPGTVAGPASQMSTFKLGGTVASCTTTNGSNLVSAALGAFGPGIAGMTVTGTGIPASTVVGWTYPLGSYSYILLSNNATASGTVTLTFNSNQCQLNSNNVFPF